MGPLRGDGNPLSSVYCFKNWSREDGSPSWGRKQASKLLKQISRLVEKMGPLRGDGNPDSALFLASSIECREDGSPSWGRKLFFTFSLCYNNDSREDGSPSWGRKQNLSPTLEILKVG